MLLYIEAELEKPVGTCWFFFFKHQNRLMKDTATTINLLHLLSLSYIQTERLSIAVIMRNMYNLVKFQALHMLIRHRQFLSEVLFVMKS